MSNAELLTRRLGVRISPRPLMSIQEEDDEEPILIRVAGGGNTTITPDEPDNARYITVDTEEEKDYLEWLRDKERYSVKGLRSKLTGMRLYQDWMQEKD